MCLHALGFGITFLGKVMHSWVFISAASSMYEYGMRLAQELPGLQSLQKQVRVV